MHFKRGEQLVPSMGLYVSCMVCRKDKAMTWFFFSTGAPGSRL